MKDIVDSTSYDHYKSTMAVYLTPNNLCNRGRFCCAYCEMIFTDQWALEKVCDPSIDRMDLVLVFFPAFTFSRT